MPNKIASNLLRYMLFGLIIIVTLSAIANAADSINIVQYSNSYEFYTGAYTAQPTVCIAGSVIDKITIRNTGQFGAVFSIDTNIPKYATLPFTSVKLNPGQSVDISILISAPSTENEQLVPYQVKVTSNLGKQKVIDRQLVIQRCQNLNAKLYAEHVRITPCVPVNYTILLENTGTFTEDYLVSAKTNIQDFDVPNQQITLKPNQKGTVSMVQALSCDFWGNTTNRFEITAKKNGLKTTLSHELQVDWGYSFGVLMPDNTNACIYESKQFPIKITNTADLDNDLKLRLEGAPNYVTLDTASLPLRAGNFSYVNILANPERKDIGIHIFKLIIEGRNGGKIEKEIDLNVKDCYKIDLNIKSDENPTICSGYTKYPITVKNNGLFTENITFSIDSPGFASLSRQNTNLYPGEEETISLLINATDDVDNRTLPITVSALLQSRGTTQQFKDSITIKVLSQGMCTLATMQKSIYARYTQNTTSLTITNNGIRMTDYRLVYAGPAFITLENNNMTLKPGESATITLNLYSDSSAPQKSYDFIISAISFANAKRYDQKVTLTMTETPFIEMACGYATSSPCHFATPVLAILIIAGLVVLVIRLARGSDRIMQSGTATRIGLVVVIILIVALVLIVFGIPSQIYPQLEKSADSTQLSWYQGGTQTIDLNKYFYDADNDTLTFTVLDQPDNMTIMQKGSTVTFVPDLNWFGSRRVRIMATDSLGQNVTSPRILLDVVEVKRYTLLQLYERYCAYINALLLILLVEIAYFILITGKVRTVSKEKVAKVGIRKQPGYLYFVDQDGDVARSTMKRQKRQAKKRKR